MSASPLIASSVDCSVSPQLTGYQSSRPTLYSFCILSQTQAGYKVCTLLCGPLCYEGGRTRMTASRMRVGKSGWCMLGARHLICIGRRQVLGQRWRDKDGSLKLVVRVRVFVVCSLVCSHLAVLFLILLGNGGTCRQVFSAGAIEASRLGRILVRRRGSKRAIDMRGAGLHSCQPRAFCKRLGQLVDY